MSTWWIRYHRTINDFTAQFFVFLWNMNNSTGALWLFFHSVQSVRLIHIQNSWMWHVLQLRVCGNTFINVLLSLFFTSDFERFNYAFKIVLHISDMAECLLCRPSIYQLCAYTFGGTRHQMSQLFSSFLLKSSKNNVYLWRTKFGSRFKPITTVLSMLKLRNLFSRAHCSPALNKKRVQLKKHKNFETIKTN